MNFLAELRRRLHAALSDLVPDPTTYAEMLRPTQDPKFGDFQANCAMPLKVVLGKPPREIAEQIVARLEVADLCELPEIAGPGFINLRLKADRLATETARLLPDERLGVLHTASPRTIVVDFSSPNVAKPMHVGHLRSTVIGNALYQVLKFLGHKVISDNHLGDWGTQFGMIIYGYKHFRDEMAYKKSPVAELSRLYRLVNQLEAYHEALVELPEVQQKLAQLNKPIREVTSVASSKMKDKELEKARKKLGSELRDVGEDIVSLTKKISDIFVDSNLFQRALAHPQIAEGARLETARLHAGDSENLQLWQEFMPACLGALHALYDRLGIHFDFTLGESYYNPMLPGVVEELQRKGLAQESHGAMCVFVEGNEAPFIVQKGDGAFTYATTDLATIRYRRETLKADEILYVVDARQSEHFELLFATARRLGYSLDYRHVSFGTILGPDRKPYKTRSGDTVGLESLLDEAVSRALKIVEENDPHGELDEAAKRQAAETVGLGGVFYADLHHNRDSDYLFDWEKMLAKTGDTATYIQYAYARACGVFRKGGIDPTRLRLADARIALQLPEERALALQLNRFAEALNAVTADYRPNLLTQYLFETANHFTTFYEKCPVLKETDAAIRTSRLQLCDLTARVLRQGLKLLGIQVVERM